jgi:membrane-bound lytic murein transglycosylase B
MRIAMNAKPLIPWALSAALALLAFPCQGLANSKCVEGLWPSAKSAGVTRATFDRAFQGFTPDPEVIEQANYQPEYVKPIGEYIDRAVSEKRIATGKLKLAEYQDLVAGLEKRYGVDRHIIVAIWGVESNYGALPGDMNVIRSLATLICSGTKAKFARPQLVSALKILQRGDVSFEAMNGSWAGAMGHTQFIPTTYTAYAVDQDGDGKRDIWNNIPDALASTASYLKVSNWRAGETWGYEVKLPKGFNPKRVGESTKSLGEWQKIGVVKVNGEPFPRAADKASLFAPEGTRGPSFLVLNNFRSILRYNVAKSYALAVGHLADRLKGYGPFVQQWPTDETHLSLAQRTELQQLLIAQGLMEGEPDGVIGPATLEAVRTYQRAKTLPVDGFPSLTILKKLRAEAPRPAPPAEGQTGSIETQAPAGAAAPAPSAPPPAKAAEGQPAGAAPAAESGGGQPADAGQN